MTREEALEYCTNTDNGVYYYPEMSILFIWTACMREDTAAAKALGASICVVPATIWPNMEVIDLNACVSALICGDIHATA